jgi:PAS domain S-box-containing protein
MHAPPALDFSQPCDRHETSVLTGAEAKFESLLEAAPAAILGVDRAGVIQFANLFTEQLFRYDRHGLIGVSVDTLVPQSLPPVPEEEWASHHSGPAVGAMGMSVELTGRRRDGTEFPAEIRLSSTIETEDGLLSTVVIRDITHLRSELELRRLAAIIESSEDAIIAKTLDGIVTSWNPAAERMYGYSPEEIIGKPISMLAHKDQADEMAHILAEVRAGRGTEHYDTVRVRKDGRVFPVLLSVSPLRDAAGTLIGASSIARDVSEQRQALDDAHTMIESSLDALVSISPEGLITDVNEATIRATGVPREELIGTRFSDCFTEPEKAEAVYQLVFAEGMAVDYRMTIRHRNGRLTEVLYNASVYRDPQGKVLGVFAAARDVTGQMQAFDDARSMIESSLDALVSISPEGMITDVNEATVKATGVPRSELIGTAFSDRFTEPEKAEAIYQKVFAEGMAVDYPLTIRHRDGRLTEVLYNASVYHDPKGNVLGVFAAARDVTKQMQAFDDARSMIESSLDSLVSISPEGMITDVNEATIKVTGVPRWELIGTAFSDRFTEPDKAEAVYQKVFAEGMAVDYPLTIRHRTGKLTEVLYNASVYRDPQGNVLGVFAAARDVTKQRQAQAEIADQLSRELERRAELEHFQRLTVGRELKMVELKKEIEGLRKYATDE